MFTRVRFQLAIFSGTSQWPAVGLSSALSFLVSLMSRCSVFRTPVASLQEVVVVGAPYLEAEEPNVKLMKPGLNP